MEEKQQKPEDVQVHIPRCCLEQWDSCPHVAKKPEKTKKNIGL